MLKGLIDSIRLTYYWSLDEEVRPVELPKKSFRFNPALAALFVAAAVVILAMLDGGPGL